MAPLGNGSANLRALCRTRPRAPSNLASPTFPCLSGCC